MYFKIFTSISKAIVLMATLSSCDFLENQSLPIEEESNEKIKTVKQEQETKKSGVKALTDSTAKEFLLEYGRSNPETKAVISTPKGNITIRLFKNTPIHRANFVYLAKEQYFDDTWFYRVSEGHVIQAGDNDEEETVKKREKFGDYTIPAEPSENYHVKGAVAAARKYNNNPDKRSMPYEFYITLGKKYSRKELRALEENYEISLTDKQLDAYSSSAGSPHLDGEHTVFGEVIDGMEVVEAISKVRVDEGEWPLINIPIEVKLQ